MNINDVLVQTKMRRRGRPRKNSIQPIKTKQSDEKTMNIEEDIIIQLPIHSKDIGDDIGDIIKTEHLEISSFEQSSNSDIVQKDDKTIQELKKIIDNKDKMIEELEGQIGKLTHVTECNHDILKNVKIYPIDTPFDKTPTGGLIVPEFTNKSCLWDTCQIDGTPCFLPDKYYDNKFYVIGMFCSINCAMSYNLSLDDSRVGERYSLLRWLYNKINEQIIPSPPRNVLDKYGGYMNINAYRKALKLCDKEYRVLMPPMTYINPTLEEKLLSKNKNPKMRNIMDDLYH